MGFLTKSDTKKSVSSGDTGKRPEQVFHKAIHCSSSVIIQYKFFIERKMCCQTRSTKSMFVTASHYHAELYNSATIKQSRNLARTFTYLRFKFTISFSFESTRCLAVLYRMEMLCLSISFSLFNVRMVFCASVDAKEVLGLTLLST